MKRLILAAALMSACSGSDSDVFTHAPATEPCAAGWEAEYSGVQLSGKCSKACQVLTKAAPTVSCLVPYINGNTGDVEYEECAGSFVTNLHDGKPVCCILISEDGVTADVAARECE